MLKDKGIKLPEFYLACGADDPFLEHNRTFYEFLKQEKVKTIYHERVENHD